MSFSVKVSVREGTRLFQIAAGDTLAVACLLGLANLGVESVFQSMAWCHYCHIARLQKAAPSTSHPLSRYQVVLTKRLLVIN